MPVASTITTSAAAIHRPLAYLYGRGQRMILLAFVVVVVVVVIGILYAVLAADDVDRMLAEAIAAQGPVPDE